MMIPSDLLLIDTTEEYPPVATEPNTQADPMTGKREVHNALYWESRCLRAEQTGTLANVETLTHGLEAIDQITDDALEADDPTEHLKRIRKWVKMVLTAVWGKR